MRKKYFNMMEDMKGKIRVYARVRPMLEFERSRGQKEALIIPDELSLEHMWKDKKREYSFDAVFSATTSQDKVRLAGRCSSTFSHSLLSQSALCNIPRTGFATFMAINLSSI